MMKRFGDGAVRRRTGGIVLLAVLAWAAMSGVGRAADAGRFVIPGLRGSGGAGAAFAYWDFFLTDDEGFNFGMTNPPALLGGEDENGHLTTLSERVGLTQTAAESAFVTSSGAIYSFSEATAFRVDYEGTGEAPVTNVIFQTQTGGRRFDIGNIRLEYFATPGDPASLESLIPSFKALDDPQSGAFAERLVSAFQWDLTGRDVRDFRLIFGAPGSSMPLWEAQIDVVEGAEFRQELGYLMLGEVRPFLRFQRPGRIEKDLPAGAETRFHLPGTRLRLIGVPASGFAHAGWAHAGEISDTAEFELVYADADLAVTAIFAPLNYNTWRNHWFDHANDLLGLPADHLNDEVSGPGADPDGDGADNFAEFAFGGDPYAADPAVRGPAVAVDAGAPLLTYRQPASALVGVTYQLFASTDLAQWSPVNAVVVDRVLDLTGYWRVTVREAVAEGNTPKPFLRMTATSQP